MEPYKPHQKRFVIFFVIAVGLVGALVHYAGDPSWQIALGAMSGALVLWRRINDWR